MNQALKPFPIDQIGAMADKQTLGAVEGHIKSIWKAKTGVNGQGNPWSIQNAILETPEGEIPLWIKDREQLPTSAKNKLVRIESAQSEKGLSGLYVYDDDYQGKVTRKLKITPSAEIIYLTQYTGAGGEPTGQSQPQTEHAKQQMEKAAKEWEEQESKNQPAAGSTQPTQPKQTRQPAPATSEIGEAKKSIMQIVNLHMLCTQAVDRVEAPMIKQCTGIDMSESQRQGAIGSVFIESCRSGLVRHMPTSPLEL